MTLGCLRTVAAEVDVPYEVVVVDNASSDETPALLDRIDGVKVLSNAENRGFVEAANQAARGANGEYLLLLNNDAELERGSVHAALEVFDREPEVGAVGGMILRLDGRLQEAGSIVWSDGSCRGYGRGDAPGHPAYMFRRDVDFCSGAFLLTPRQRFLDLGGFDERFSPAYYEETDYCLRLREHGLSTVYEPRARIRHYEFASFDSAERAVALQARNHAKFAAKHRERLSGQLPPDPANLHRARTPGNAPRVLYIDDRVPHTSLGSGFPRANRVVDALADAGYLVTVYPLNFPREDTWASAYRDISRRVEIALGHGREEIFGFLDERSGLYDLVFVSRPHNMQFLDQVLESRELPADVKLVYDAEAIFALREAEQAVVEGRDPESAGIANAIDRELGGSATPSRQARPRPRSLNDRAFSSSAISTKTALPTSTRSLGSVGRCYRIFRPQSSLKWSAPACRCRHVAWRASASACTAGSRISKPSIPAPASSSRRRDSPPVYRSRCSTRPRAACPSSPPSCSNASSAGNRESSSSPRPAPMRANSPRS